MLPYRTNWITVLVLAIFFVAILGYAYFEARNVIGGPSIETATSGAVVVREQLVIIKGVASNITEIQMNGRPISTTEAGTFEEAHLLAEGYNAILLTARDKIGRTTVKKIEIVYEPIATSTASTSTRSL